jgi:uncharacterized protein (DUF3084 family)
MQLLTPDIVKNDTEARANELSSRIEEATTEETTIVKKLNDAKELYEKEMERLQAELESKQKELQSIIDPLKGEVRELELRRAEALKPVEEILAEAQKTLDEAKLRLEPLETRERDIADREADLLTRTQIIDDYKLEIEARDDEVNARIRAISGEEESTRQSLEELDGKWGAYHNVILINERSLEEKHSRISERESMCNVREGSLAEREAELNNKEILLKNMYSDLQRATELTQP